MSAPVEAAECNGVSSTAPDFETWEDTAVTLENDVAKLSLASGGAPVASGSTYHDEMQEKTAQDGAAAVCDGTEQGAEPVCDQRQGPSVDLSSIDPAIVQALGDPQQRASALRIEELVGEYLNDVTMDVLQFPGNYTSYQRMLAHRVCQYYGLETSTIDSEGLKQGRVIATRTKATEPDKVKLAALDVPRATSTSAPGRSDGGDRMWILRRDGSGRTAGSGQEQGDSASPARSFKERQDDYNRTRERLLGPSAADGRGRGAGGRGLGAGRGDGGRGRKAVFRNKDADLKDPDYTRGVNRFSGAARFDPNFQYASMPGAGMYHVPTYQSEFPSLGSSQAAGSGSSAAGQGIGAVRPPPPPPSTSASKQAHGSSAAMAPMAPTAYATAVTPMPGYPMQMPMQIPAYPMQGMYMPPGAYYPGMHAAYGYPAPDAMAMQHGYGGYAYPMAGMALHPPAMGMRPPMMAYGYDPQYAMMQQQHMAHMALPHGGSGSGPGSGSGKPHRSTSNSAEQSMKH